METGYSHIRYAETYKSLGAIESLSLGLEGHVLRRAIPNTGYTDLCSIYPVFAPTNVNTKLAKAQERDIKSLYDQGVVSLTLVTDPLFDLSRHENSGKIAGLPFDYIKKYKNHYIVNLQEPWTIDKGHQRNIRKAISSGVEVQHVLLDETNIERYAAEFHNLYSTLSKRHNITGVSNYNYTQVLNQLRVPGTVLLQSYEFISTNLIPTGFILFYIEGDIVRYHLGCYSDLGYSSSASFLLMFKGMELFRQMGYTKLVLGAGAGAGTSSESDGLIRFKSGWTSHHLPNYIIGKIINSEMYNKLSNGSEYFPSYRFN